jgi:hypothetical protein
MNFGIIKIDLNNKDYEFIFEEKFIPVLKQLPLFYKDEMIQGLAHANYKDFA